MKLRLTSENKALKITWLGLAANIILALSKGFFGIVANSSALIADAGHSFSDIFSDAITLWALRISSIPKDKNHPYGHGKFETIGTFFIALLLFITGIGIAWHVFNKINTPVVPGIISLWVAGIAIIVKEFLFQINKMEGRKTGSRVLLANAWHHRTDALSSVAALLGILGARWGFPLMDPIVGLLVAGLILKTGIDIGYGSIRELTDENVEEEIIFELRKILTGVEGVNNFHEMRARRMGAYLLVDLHIEVDSMISISVAHQVAERVRLGILEKLPIVNEVLVHVDAENDLIKEMESLISKKSLLMRPQREIENDVRNILNAINEIKGITHIYCHFLNQKLTAEISIILDNDLRIREAKKIALEAKFKIQQIKDIDYADIHLEIGDNS